MKDLRFEMRLDQVTAQKLEALAKQTGKTQSETLRGLIYQATQTQPASAGQQPQPQPQPQGRG